MGGGNQTTFYSFHHLLDKRPHAAAGSSSTSQYYLYELDKSGSFCVIWKLNILSMTFGSFGLKWQRIFKGIKKNIPRCMVTRVYS